MFETKICPNCKNSVRDEAAFCLDCGERIENIENGIESDEQKSGSADTVEAVKMEKINKMISDDLLAFDKIVETKPYLKVIEGIDKGVVISLGDRRLLGRKMSGDGWKLSDPYISREHVVIVKDDDNYLLKNISDTNGTKVNGVEIDEHVLTPGDQIEIGFTVMSFQKSDD